MSDFDGWKYHADCDATILAYVRTERSGADTCDCAGCRNFRVARADCFPPEFLALLDQLGIDPRKDAEVYHKARLASGRHDYGDGITSLVRSAKSATLHVLSSSRLLACGCVQSQRHGYQAWKVRKLCS